MELTRALHSRFPTKTLPESFCARQTLSGDGGWEFRVRKNCVSQVMLTSGFCDASPTYFASSQPKSHRELLVSLSGFAYAPRLWFSVWVVQ